ncbi:MAG: hypothetical protein PGN13_04680, partial [Patulibacter minatonensis]
MSAGALGERVDEPRRLLILAALEQDLGEQHAGAQLREREAHALHEREGLAGRYASAAADDPNIRCQKPRTW